MLRDSASSDVGTDTSTVRSGPDSFFSRGCSSCRSRCFCGTARHGRRAAYPFFCVSSAPCLPHPKARTFKNKTARIRKRGEKEIGLLSVSRYWVHRRRRDLGKVFAGSHRKVLYGSNGGGAKHGAAKSLLDLRCGMVWWPQIILCRHRADLPVTAEGGLLTARVLGVARRS